MTIESNTFGGVRLSGKDADQFIKQIIEEKSNPKAQEALARGRLLISKMEELQNANK